MNQNKTSPKIFLTAQLRDIIGHTNKQLLAYCFLVEEKFLKLLFDLVLFKLCTLLVYLVAVIQQIQKSYVLHFLAYFT